MSIYYDIMNKTYNKHKGHNLSEEYKVDGYGNQRIRICKDCNIALLYNIEGD